MTGSLIILFLVTGICLIINIMLSKTRSPYLFPWPVEYDPNAGHPKNSAAARVAFFAGFPKENICSLLKRELKKRSHGVTCGHGTLTSPSAR
jgi:hypothetical protein